MRNILLATAALSLMAVPAMAQTVSNPQWYGTAGYTAFDTDNGDIPLQTRYELGYFVGISFNMGK